MTGQEITLISTYAKDRLINAKTGKVIREQKGGPILYLKKALEKLGVRPTILTGQELVVDILIEDEDEHGKIDDKPKKLPIPNLKTPFALVSTILDEWDLKKASKSSSKFFVDIQGYVRDGTDFGKKKYWKEIENFANSIFCLKGNKEEISYLPKKVVDLKKRKGLLIITKDKNGVEIFHHGKHYSFSPEMQLEPKHTIGAGDTWFANFVARFIKTKDVKVSTNFAIKKTSEFLQDLS